jgi:uncharacterized low-complexity protein
MIGKTTRKPLAAAIGAAMATTLAAMPAANADETPLGMTSLADGYMVAGKEGKCGEGKCGEGKDAGGVKRLKASAAVPRNTKGSAAVRSSLGGLTGVPQGALRDTNLISYPVSRL